MSLVNYLVQPLRQKYPVYLFVATLSYSQLTYVEPCLIMKKQS